MKSLHFVKKMILLAGLVAAASNATMVQTKFSWQSDKPGQWIYKYNIQVNSTDEALFQKNVKNMVDWFRQNLPLLNKPMGFDINVYVSRGWDNHYQMSPSNYGLTADIKFSFHLFGKNGSIWKAELPSASYSNLIVNRLTGSGNWIGPIGQFDYFNNTKHDPKIEKAINKAASKLYEMMTVFPMKEEIIPGVHVYENGSLNRNVVIFNPDRPPYLIPVTLRELTQAYLNYYSLFQTLEIDQMLLKELKKEIGAFSDKELDGPAYAGHPTNIVFRYSSDKRNLPIMKLNPEYWDKSLPPSAIQLIVLYDPKASEDDMKKHLEKFGYPINAQILFNQINCSQAIELIMKGN